MLTTLILPIINTGYLSIYLHLLQFLSSIFYSFQYTDLSPPSWIYVYFIIFDDVCCWNSLFFLRLPLHHGNSHTRGQIRAAAGSLPHTQSKTQIWATSATYVGACSGAGSLLDTLSQTRDPRRHYVAFLTHWATMGTPGIIFLISVFYSL